MIENPSNLSSYSNKAISFSDSSNLKQSLNDDLLNQYQEPYKHIKNNKNTLNSCTKSIEKDHDHENDIEILNRTNLEHTCFVISNSSNAAESEKYYSKFYPGQKNQQSWITKEDDNHIQKNQIVNENSSFYINNNHDGTIVTLNDLENINPAFTIRRHFIQIQEDQKLIETLKKSIENKLKISLPTARSVEEMGVSLADGVVLCHLINQIFPRAITCIHVPSLAMVCFKKTQSFNKIIKKEKKKY